MAEEDQEGRPEKSELMYFDEKFIDKYRGCIQVGNRVVANSEIRLCHDKSSYNLDSHNMWYFISDFYVDPKYRNNGFEKSLVEGITNFARTRKINVVKKVKKMSRLEELFNPLMQLLKQNGFFRFDENTLYYTYDGGEIQNEQS
jgi:GNAT superfamily N-acetyltransferase